ncbi:MAG: bifunctional ADP-dependent NAD(P)H-hydrate dehydratase/NAD(P)H-hydrate epimerase, partial [Bacteroidales bacterium]|nr:bifunctional ADP-dependent NAD(P)H-hydrate dehydratase/NAD(P)H-hydrate epimerase [Bacteroidales bacterium]
GAYTQIHSPQGITYFNSTGNPGMATGGSGDVLTGILLGLLAQNYSPLDAALIGTYIHGLAGNLALEKQSHESLIASDIIEHLGKAFQSLHNFN